MEKAGRTKKVLLNLGLIVVGFFIALGVLEIFLRFYDPFGFRVKGNKIILPLNKKYVFENTVCDKIDRQVVHTKNAIGFRGPAMPEDFADRLSIVAVGGSTTECLMLSDQHDWVSLLGERLREDFKGVWINNAGIDGHSTFGHYLLMDRYIKKLHPKVVLFLVGTNDTDFHQSYYCDMSIINRKMCFAHVRDGVGNIVASVLRGEFGQCGAQCRWLFLGLSEYSSLMSCLVNLQRYAHARHMHVTHQCVDINALPVRDMSRSEVDRILQEMQPAVHGYRERLVRLVEFVKKAGIVPVLITQPALFGTGIDPDTGTNIGDMAADEYNGQTKWEILELFNDVTREVGREEQVPVIDLARRLPKRSRYFYDFIHFTNAGAQEVADIIASEIRTPLTRTFPEYVVDPTENDRAIPFNFTGRSQPKNR